jgi:hypothetical protein
MLEKSDTPIGDVLKVFNAFDLDVSLLVPTQTGLSKSIMDATASVREYLQEFSYHDYDKQGQGTDGKIVRQAYFVHPDRLEATTVSLYRPTSKKGDPRIWFSGLPRYADPLNLLALFIYRDDLYVVNCAAKGVLASIHDAGRPLGSIAASLRPAIDPAVTELLDLIRDISARGFVPTLRPGDTGIGMTLETLLGIAANAKKTPDYKGIEIKTKRLGKRIGNRVTLFSQVPNWNLSPIGSAWKLLSEYGYERNGKLRLNHEIDASGPNSIGFYLGLDAEKDWLKQMHFGAESGDRKHVTTWELETLRQRLAEKHPQTFWVGAKVRGKRETEEFHYVQIQHTRRPKVRNFDALLEGGQISVDYLMSQKAPGRPTVRDHGYLFKINPRDFDALFPPAEVHVLA